MSHPSPLYDPVENYHREHGRYPSGSSKSRALKKKRGGVDVKGTGFRVMKGDADSARLAHAIHNAPPYNEHEARKAHRAHNLKDRNRLKEISLRHALKR